jgi:DNA-directed RNA polymerase specialized sigma subunit
MSKTRFAGYVALYDYPGDRKKRARFCRNKLAEIMGKLAMTLVFEMDLSYALTAPLLGVSASAVCQIIKTASAADCK